MRKVKITGRGLPKYQQQPGTIGDFTCAYGERFDETLGQCVPDVNYTAAPATNIQQEEVKDFNGCIIGKEVWSVANQKCIPINEQEPQKFNVNSKLSTGTPKTGPSTGVNPQSNLDQSLYRAFPGAALAAIGVNMLSGVADKLQNADLQKRVEEAQKRFGMTDSRFGPMRNVYSYGRTPTGYAYNQMVPVQFAGKPTFEAMTVPQFAQDGIEVVRDIMQLPTLYTGDPTASGLYAEDPTIKAAMTRRYADVELPKPTAKSEDLVNVLVSPPIGPDNAPPLVPSKKSNFKSSGVNPLAKSTWQDVSSQYPGVKFLGIWGDKRHQKTKSDHNSGDALDIGISSEDQGTQIAQKLIKEAQERNIKYIIWNKKIWNSSVSNDWRPYSGDSPHTDHVHVSFNRNPETLGQISLTHNNPLNIHQGPFATKYGGKQGAKDGNGFVSMFPDMNTGVQAAKDLLFNPNSAYFNLRISEARNRWVNGNVDQPSESTRHIVKSMGKDVYISQLTPVEKDKLLKLFAKWEGKQGYNAIKDLPLFKEGGVYELDDNEIQQILANGGQIEFL